MHPILPPARSRRQLLRQMGGGFGATALQWMLQAAAVRSNPALTPKPAHFPAKAKACIFLFMYGGPSQVDTFDPKPELAKRHGQPIPNLDNDPLLKVRKPGSLLGSTRQFTRYGQSGIEVSDLYPNVGRMVDDVAIIRGTWADSFAHGSGLLQMNTGFIRQGFPSVGSWVTYGLGSENQNLPAYIVLLDHRGGPISGPPNWSAGFMPATFQGTQLRTSGDPVLFLQPQPGTTREQQRRQLDLLGRMAELSPAAGPENQELEARIASYELAYRMQTAAPEVVALDRETAATRQAYGLDDPRTQRFGTKCLIARRLVERGVRFVQLYSGGGHGDDNWDAHGDVDKNHAKHAGETDGPIAALLQDLKQRGMLDSTLVVWAGEFGRTPTSQNTKGRDHSPRGFSTWMAGGGVKGGQVVGATDEFGYAAVENKVHVHDLHATMLHLMGLDHTRLTFFHGGRNMRLTDVHGNLVRQLLA